MYDEAKVNLAGIDNIEQRKGDTRTHLPSIFDKQNHLLFWLDTHWSGGATYGEKDECPLIEEYQSILSGSVPKEMLLISDEKIREAKCWKNIYAGMEL